MLWFSWAKLKSVEVPKTSIEKNIFTMQYIFCEMALSYTLALVYHLNNKLWTRLMSERKIRLAKGTPYFFQDIQL